MDPQTIAAVANYCSQKLPLVNAKLGNEYYKGSMPLCVIDAVFSIGVRYEAVTNTLKRVCSYYNITQDASEHGVVPDTKDQVSTTAFLKMVGDKTPEALAREVYGNRQRTSATNGILKAEAVSLFLNVLRDHNAEYFQDIPRLINDSGFERAITAIPGQRSGTSLKYFFMLSGNDDFIKPDRMIIRFLKDATGQTFNVNECQAILHAATAELNRSGYTIMPRLLDNVIWNYQRTIPVERATHPNRMFAIGTQVDFG